MRSLTHLQVDTAGILVHWSHEIILSGGNNEQEVTFKFEGGEYSLTRFL